MTAPVIERARSGCALHGALATFGAVEGVVPIVHATAGCTAHYQRGIVPFGGSVPASAALGPPLSASNVGEKHVVFGGASRLREQIKNTVKVIDGSLYVVVTGCATEMVGDDIAAMTKEGRDEGFAVIHANTPGFLGSAHRGYEIALKTLIGQVEVSAEATAGAGPRVNLLGVVPHQDVFWQGHTGGLVDLLAAVGVAANPVIGPGRSVQSLNALGQADLNLVISPWGQSAAQLLQHRHGTPWIDIGAIPVGAAATGRFLDAVGAALDLDAAVTGAFRTREEQRLKDKLAHLAPAYFALGFQRDFAIVGELALVTGLAGFLTETLGLIPTLALVTDPLSEEQRAACTRGLRDVLARFGATLAFTEDAGEIKALLEASDAELLLGSSLDRPIAEALAVPFLAVSFPVADRLVIDRGYVGYDGAIAFAEDLGTALLAHAVSCRQP